MWDGEAEQTMDAINDLALRCGGCDTVCMLSNIMCYCTDEQVRAWHPSLKWLLETASLHLDLDLVAIVASCQKRMTRMCSDDLPMSRT